MRASRPWPPFLKALALGLTASLLVVFSPLVAQTQLEAPSLGGTIDHILMDIDKVKSFTSSIQQSVFPLKSKAPTKPGELDGIHNIRKGVTTAISCGDRVLFFMPAALVEGTSSVEAQLNRKEWVPVSVLGQIGEMPLAVGVVDLKKHHQVTPLRLEEEIEDRVPGLVVSAIGSYGFEVLSRVHIIGSPMPPLANFRITDIRSAAGLPLLSVNKRVRAIPVRPWMNQEQTLAVPAKAIQKFCDNKAIPSPIVSPSLEVNPR